MQVIGKDIIRRPSVRRVRPRLIASEASMGGLEDPQKKPPQAVPGRARPPQAVLVLLRCLQYELLVPPSHKNTIKYELLVPLSHKNAIKYELLVWDFCCVEY